ncbi:hypothetical protein LguiA_029740 [Lonicera macranthoides]
MGKFTNQSKFEGDVKLAMSLLLKNIAGSPLYVLRAFNRISGNLLFPTTSAKELAKFSEEHILVDETKSPK